MADLLKRAQEVSESIPSLYRGPGGCIAILKDGHPIHQQVWGYADLDQHIPLSSSTQMPICSISKQMVCMMLFSLIQNPTEAIKAKGGKTWDLVSKELQDYLPNGLGKEVTLENLCNNQSGIRDYWAMSTLWGAHPEQKFSLERDAPQAIERTRSLHFELGTEYSYCNLNFHILARLLEKVSGAPLEKLLEKRLFKPADMKTAALRADTAALPKPCVGYDGDEQHGFRAATNRIEWSGDAGVVATLEDMIAYEQYLDRSWNDSNSPYRSISQPQTYKDGKPAEYGYGLERGEVGGKGTLGHGGALRGFRLHRVHVPSERLSVVVLFNHEADAGDAAKDILKHLLDIKEDEKDDQSIAYPALLSSWTHTFLDTAARLVVQVTQSPTEQGQLCIAYTGSGGTETVSIDKNNPSIAKSSSITCSLSRDRQTLSIDRFKENRLVSAYRLNTCKPINDNGEDYAGTYTSASVDSKFHCTASGSGEVLYGSFEGYLGHGPAHLLRRVGVDTFLLADPRGLDAPAPGDWTCMFDRTDGGSGNICGVTIGCWLARKVEFTKQT